MIKYLNKKHHINFYKAIIIAFFFNFIFSNEILKDFDRCLWIKSDQITNEKSTPKDNNNWNSALFNFQTPLNRNSSNPSDVLNVGNGFNTLKSQPPSAPSTSINPLTSAFNSSSWEPIGNTNSQINSNNNDNNKPVSNFFVAQSSVTDNGGNGWDANANFSNRNSTNGNVNLKWT